MKKLLLIKFIFLLFLLPAQLFAQPGSDREIDITGLWKGALYNDTTKKYLPYEIAISGENGKLSGYSYTLFDIDGKKEMGVKKIKIKRKDDQLIIEDVELIANDYTVPPPKKVRQQSVVHLVVNDTAMVLSGTWSTNRTMVYRPLTGSISVTRARDFKAQVLFKKLENLNLEQDLSFVKAEKAQATAIASRQEKVTAPRSPIPAGQPRDIDKPLPKNNESTLVNPGLVTGTVSPKETQLAVAPAKRLTITDTAKLNPVALTEKNIKTSPVKDFPVTSKPATVIASVTPVESKPTSDPKVEKKTDVTVASNKPPVSITAAKNEAKQQPAIPSPVAARANPPATVKEITKKETTPLATTVQPAGNNKPSMSTAPVVVTRAPALPATKLPPVTTVNPPEQKKETIVAVSKPNTMVAAANVAERIMSREQSVYFESDSLMLTLYDNGDVDGDTVSVIMNGQIIFARQGLSTKPVSKTIYIDKGITDTLSMIMYAENLGSIPPNTGLLIIMDGEKRYEVRFSADLKTNAAILLRRKPKDN